MFSKKATKIDEIFTFYLTLTTLLQTGCMQTMFFWHANQKEKKRFWQSDLNDKSIPNICSLVYRNVIYDDPLCGDPVLSGTWSYSGHGVQRKCWYLECGLYHGWNDTRWGPFSRHRSYWPVEQNHRYVDLLINLQIFWDHYNRKVTTVFEIEYSWSFQSDLLHWNN